MTTLEYITSIEDVKVGDKVFVTTDFPVLKKEWLACDNGPMSDADMRGYCGCSATVTEVEDDDDTVQLQWVTMDTQWIPALACVRNLPKDQQKTAPMPFIPQFNGTGAENMATEGGQLNYLSSCEECKINQTVYVTTCFKTLREKWEECGLGTLSDDDLRAYCGCPGIITEIEDDDDTLQLQWITMDTQWIPLEACVLDLPADQRKDAPASFIPRLNGTGADNDAELVYLTIDEVKVNERVFVTPDFELLKKEWEAAEMGKMSDNDLRGYCGCGGRITEVEDDDDTVQLEWLTMDTQWIPVACCTRDLPKDQQRDAPMSFIPRLNGTGADNMAEEFELKYLTSIEDAKGGATVYVTTDFEKFKQEWKECELGPLSDEDLKAYCGCPGKITEIEDDDDTLQLQWLNMDTQWIPALACVHDLPESQRKTAPQAFIPKMNGTGADNMADE